jgi:hypothetical protein
VPFGEQLRERPIRPRSDEVSSHGQTCAVGLRGVSQNRCTTGAPPACPRPPGTRSGISTGGQPGGGFSRITGGVRQLP